MRAPATADVVFAFTISDSLATPAVPAGGGQPGCAPKERSLSVSVRARPRHSVLKGVTHAVLKGVTHAVLKGVTHAVLRDVTQSVLKAVALFAKQLPDWL
jgi:hypothetical protein